jgi:hemolysin activation/secretion protein
MKRLSGEKDIEASVNSPGLSEPSPRKPRIAKSARTATLRVGGLGVCGLVLCMSAAASAAAKPEIKPEIKSAADAGKLAATKSGASAPAAAQPAKGGSDAAKPAAAADPAAAARFDIDEYRVEGADSLPQIEIEAAVYPFLGPHKSAKDVESARAAVEKAYHDKGLQTVSVAVPQQDAQRGFVVLKVTENRVGRLRVKGSRYFDLANIKNNAPSLKEGTLPDFQAVTKDIVSLNRWSDRRITPALRAGVTPGTVDVDLNVEDTFPLHGSAELNNRQSPSTTPLRSSISLRYDDLGSSVIR